MGEARGFIQEGETPSKQELTSLMFKSGMSTAENEDMHAGRGAGLSYVRTAIAQINGKISVHSDPGKHTRFTISIPITNELAGATR
jgi:two-component system chemotaxis sensor kinase CheA